MLNHLLLEVLQSRHFVEQDILDVFLLASELEFLLGLLVVVSEIHALSPIKHSFGLSRH